MGYRPEGYNAVSPYLVVAGAEREMAFLEEVFGAERLRRYDKEDGSIMHAEVRVGDTVVMLGDAADEWPAVPCHLHVYVEDVDTVYRKALEAGATSVREPLQRSADDDRRGGVMSPGGTTWWIATQPE